MAAKFRFLVNDFVDKRVLFRGNELSVFEVTDKHVYLVHTDAEQPVTRRNCKRVSSLDAVCGHVRALMHDEKGHKKTRLADDVKQIVKIIEGQLRRKFGDLQARLDKYDQHEAGRGQQLNKCEINVGEVSLVTRIASTKTKIAEHKVVLVSLGTVSQRFRQLRISSQTISM
jgi:hypothetical protein